MEITKLPKWAQDHIRHLQMERDAAVRALRDFEDSQTPSRIYQETHECTGEEVGPSVIRRYIQGHSVTFVIDPATRATIDVDLRHDGSVHISGSGVLNFQPIAANTLAVGTDRRWA